MDDNKRRDSQEAIGGLFIARAREPALCETSCKPVMSALGHKRTFCDVRTMSALHQKADIRRLGRQLWPFLVALAMPPLAFDLNEHQARQGFRRTAS
jgi:hypothetical protein